MKNSYQLKRFLLGSWLLLWATWGQALSLGRLQGAAWVGQALQVGAKIQWTAEEDLNSLCLEAEVFYGDSRVPAEQVLVQQEPGSGALESAIQIRSKLAVDEPVVTVYLRAGCAQKVSRRYVLLAEIPSDIPAPGHVVRSQSILDASVGLQAEPSSLMVESAASAVASKSAGRAVSSPSSVPARRGTSAVVPSVQKSSLVSKALPSAASAPTNKPRLKLDFNDQVPTALNLKPSGNLAAVPLENDPRRQQAQSAWKAISQDPAEAGLADATARKSLESEIRQLQEAVRQVQANNRELSQRLQGAEAERYANGLVYFLLALLLLMGGLLLKVWRARAKGHAPDWWRGDSTPVPPDGAVVVEPETANVSMPSAQSEPVAPVLSPAAPTSERVASETPVAPVIALHELAGGLQSPGREVNAEELFDIQQQADFFKSLGQYDQAISLLVAHIQESADTSPLVYLDLLAIYHQLQRGEDYTQLRSEFNRAFNAKVPPMESFDTHSEGLESYERALSRVESLWNTPKVLEVLEESVFRRPAQGDDKPFDLEAYRELLMLHGIAKEVLSDAEFEAPVVAELPAQDSEDSDWGGGGRISGFFSDTSIQPLQAFRGEFGDVPEKPGLMGYGPLALDIDLSQSAGVLDARSAPSGRAEGGAGADWSPQAAGPAHFRGEMVEPLSVPVQDSMPMLDFDLGEEITLTEKNVKLGGSADAT